LSIAPRSFTSLLARTPARGLTLALFGALAATSAGDAQAHIKLLQPASWAVEDDLGNPQKDGPCGAADGDEIEETGDVTTFRAGEEITVEWQETVGHPGHFRIAVATDRDDLFDPEVETTNGDGVSGNSISAEIMSPVAYPVLVDGLFPRDSVSGAQATPFSTTVKLPDEPCDNCTLQVIQFMSQHGPGYFYHHCANIKIVAADAELPGDDDATGAAGSASVGAAGSANASAAGSANASSAGSGSGGTRSTSSANDNDDDDDDDGDSDDGGCSVSAHPRPVSGAALGGLALLGAVSVWRRRRQNRR
jgi:MYXO-CTERM domain-containing protein